MALGRGLDNESLRPIMDNDAKETSSIIARKRKHDDDVQASIREKILAYHQEMDRFRRLIARPFHPRTAAAESVEAKTIADQQTFSVPDGEEEEKDQGEDETVKNRALHECVGCGESYASPILVTPCNHEYCRECLTRLFTACLKDESLYPPRCCGESIPLSTAKLWVPGALFEQFELKKIEYETPNRTYCHRPDCSAFIAPSNIFGNVATCAKCGNRTCTFCNSRSHAGNDECPNDPAVQRLAQLAMEKGWQKCPGCGRYIELDTGCYHMTCPCRVQFCYLCRAPWKTCWCPQAEVDGLWNEAERAMMNYALDRAGGFQRRQGRPDLGLNHQLDLMAFFEGPYLAWERRGRDRPAREPRECEHPGWRSQRGPLACEVCNETMPTYLYECWECGLLTCRRCRPRRD